jgi:hypothetical protein
MDGGSLEKAQLHMTISMKKDVVNYSPKWVDVVYFSATIYGSKSKRSRQNRDFAVLDQLQEISSLESVISWGRDVIGGIQPKFVYQFAFLIYYKPMEDWEVEENTNIDVVKEIQENYLWLSEYAEAHVNVLDEVTHSYSHLGNPKLDQTK